MKLKARIIVAALGVLAAAGAWADGNGTEVRMRTLLAGGAIAGKTPSGNADFRSETSRNRSRLNVEVENVNEADGTMLTVSVTHSGTTSRVGTIRLHLGFGEMELNSEDGGMPPAIMKGDVVTVNDAGGAILTGVF